jgi:transcriptional regulator with XRE-family HTH domain
MHEWLRKARKEKNFTQQYVAEKCGIAANYYSYIETGERRPSVAVAKKIAALFGFDWTAFYKDGIKTPAYHQARFN